MLSQLRWLRSESMSISSSSIMEKLATCTNQVTAISRGSYWKTARSELYVYTFVFTLNWESSSSPTVEGPGSFSLVSALLRISSMSISYGGIRTMLHECISEQSFDSALISFSTLLHTWGSCSSPSGSLKSSSAPNFRMEDSSSLLNGAELYVVKHTNVEVNQELHSTDEITLIDPKWWIKNNYVNDMTCQYYVCQHIWFKEVDKQKRERQWSGLPGGSSAGVEDSFPCRVHPLDDQVV